MTPPRPLRVSASPREIQDTLVRLAAGVLVAVATACTSGPGPVNGLPYEQQVMAWREAKDASFRRDGSPLPADQRAAFTGLAYYPIDPAYHVPARLTEDRTGPAVIIELQTSTNQRRRMRRVGTLGFTLGDVPYTLSAFADENDRVMARLFVPFGDLTSGVDETYKGGRYLDLDRTPTGLYDLDFNRAYHPYCVYSPDYDCPVPPRENRLAVAVRAGEKLSSPKH
jgi:uncharacterized protein (DUF1684 family)